MQVNAQNYERMRGWFAYIARQFFADHIGTWSDPIAALDRMAATVSDAKARQGLAMAINDFVEMTSTLSPDEVAALDRDLSRQNLPSLTEIRLVFSKDVQRVLRKGTIRSDVEYYAIRNAVEFIEGDRERLWHLLGEYERYSISDSSTPPA